MNMRANGWPVAAAALVALTAATHGSPFQTSFEQPAYSPGDDLLLSGVDGWNIGGSGDGGAFVVTEGFARTGSQSVRVQHPALGGTIHSASRSWTDNSAPILQLSAWFHMHNSTQAGRYFGFQIGGGGSNMAGGISAGMAIDGSGELRAATAYTSFYSTSGVVESGRRDDFIDRWINMTIRADLTGTVDNVVVTWSGMGTEHGSGTVSHAMSRTWTAADFTNITLITDWSTTGNTNLLGYIDDLTVIQSIPAPGALALLGLAGLVGTRRRR